MSISKRLNSDANPTNMLKLTDGLNLCENETAQRVKYAVTFDSTALTSITKISVGGSEVNLSSAEDTTAAIATVAPSLRDKIIAVVEGLDPAYLYDPVNDGGMSITKSGNNITIEIYNSTLVFDYVESNSYPFNP